MRYIEKLHDYFKDHSIVRKATKAKHYYDADKVEQLNKLITAGMLHTEKNAGTV